MTALSLMRLTDYSGGKIVSGSINFRNNDGDTIDLANANQDFMGLIKMIELLPNRSHCMY